MEKILNVKDTGYKASNLGYIIDPKGNKCTITLNDTGYCYIRINKKKVLLHRIIAETFLPNPEGKSQVNHKNGDKTNNCVWNLEWCTPYENKMHSKYVLGNSMDGINNPMYGVNGRLSPVYKDDIVQLDKYGNKLNIFTTGLEAAKYINGNQAGIYKCLSPKCVNKTYKGYYWLYLNDYKKMLEVDLKPREFMETLKKRDNHDPSLQIKEGATTIETVDRNIENGVEQGSSELEARGPVYR